MATVLNTFRNLTFNIILQDYVLELQAFLRGGPQIQPKFGLTKNRPVAGQLWPRDETQRSRFIE